MAFSSPKPIPQQAMPVAPPPPPNPPMFGENARKGKPPAGKAQQFNSSVLGSLPAGQAQKSLLGQ